jgi:hypothetical protein
MNPDLSSHGIGAHQRGEESSTMSRPFKGTVNLDVRDSKPDWPAFLADKAPEGAPNVPILRQTRWESSVVVTLDKPTLIFISDNISDTGKTELELTATEIKQP